MIYDLLGFDIGWMAKKTGTTTLKSNIIQMIFIIKAIIEAIAKNGLECGTESNYDQKQMKFILEQALNPKLPDGTKFTVKENGEVVLTQKDIAKTIDNSKQQKDKEAKPFTGDKANDKIEQEYVTTTIKDCFRSVSKEELSKAREWISDFEKGGLTNG
jgi:hypothetical protein